MRGCSVAAEGALSPQQFWHLTDSGHGGLELMAVDRRISRRADQLELPFGPSPNQWFRVQSDRRVLGLQPSAEAQGMVDRMRTVSPEERWEMVPVEHHRNWGPRGR